MILVLLEGFSLTILRPQQKRIGSKYNFFFETVAFKMGKMFEKYELNCISDKTPGFFEYKYPLF